MNYRTWEYSCRPFPLALWKIASEQLGDGTAWAAIKEVNKDILKGGDAVRPNMRLRLPAKPVATIN